MKQLRLLMIDDTDENYELVRDFFDKDLYLIDYERNPLNGIKHAKEKPPDLIILDIIMEPLDGFGVIKRLQQQEKTRSIPIVIFSVIGDDDITKLRGLGLGIDHFVRSYRPGSLQLLDEL